MRVSTERRKLLRWTSSSDLSQVRIRGRLSGVRVRFVKEDIEDLNKMYGLDVERLLINVLKQEISKHG